MDAQGVGETSAARVPTGSVCLTSLLTHRLREAWDQSGVHVSARSRLAVSLGAVDEHFVELFEHVLHSFMGWIVRQAWSPEGTRERLRKTKFLIFTVSRESLQGMKGSCSGSVKGASMTK